MSDFVIPDVTSPIYAARSWQVRPQGKVPGLPTRTILRSGSDGRFGLSSDWPVGEPLHARCNNHPAGSGLVYYTATGPTAEQLAQVNSRSEAYEASHKEPPPIPTCSCGIYGVSDPYLLEHYLTKDAVVGVLALWGRVVPADHGWRGEFGQPVAIVSDGDKQSAYIAKLYGIPLYDAWPTLTNPREMAS